MTSSRTSLRPGNLARMAQQVTVEWSQPSSHLTSGGAISEVNGTLSAMRGSDGVDIGFGVAPRSWVRGFMIALLVVMAVTGWYEPVLWYVSDKAAALTETLLPALESLGHSD